jgi:hypothetical protein
MHVPPQDRLIISLGSQLSGSSDSILSSLQAFLLARIALPFASFHLPGDKQLRYSLSTSPRNP